MNPVRRYHLYLIFVRLLGGTFPNSDSIAFGNRQSTGIEIEVVSDSKFVIVLKVSGIS